MLRATVIAHLSRCLCTRLFSEPTFRPSRPTNHRKNRMFRRSPNISGTCIFFLLTLSLFYSSSLLVDSSLLCFSCLHVIGSLTFKLPLMRLMPPPLDNQLGMYRVKGDILFKNITEIILPVPRFFQSLRENMFCPSTFSNCTFANFTFFSDWPSCNLVCFPYVFYDIFSKYSSLLSLCR